MLSEDIIIREAKPGDIETLRRFEQGLAAAERPFDPTLKPHPNHYYDIEQMIEDPLVELLVAEVQGQMVGCGYARIERSRHYLRHERHAYLGFMYVEPAWRGRNINQLIIEKLEQWSVSKGITEMRLDVYHDNIPAIKAYEKSGFSKLLIQMRMSLDKK